MSKLLYISGTIVIAYLFDVTFRELWATYRAQQLAQQSGKPLLNVGSGTATSSFTGAKLRGDINCDISAPKDASCGSTTVCYCDAEDLSQFSDKEFGVAVAVNVLCYVPDYNKAIQELNRVADQVIVTSNWLPWPQLGKGPRFPVN